MKFQNKKVWITGASSGIGEALAKELSNHGAKLILSARRKELLESIKSECKGPQENINILTVDLEKTELIRLIVEEAWNFYNGIDIVFLNAGMAVRDLVVNTTLALDRKVLDINFFGSVAVAKALLPKFNHRGTGHFVVTSSLSGIYGVPKLAAYSASKHALHGYFESLRAEICQSGIKVTIIIPGFIKTNISVNALKGDGRPFGRMQESLANGMDPNVCALKILKGVAKHKEEILIGGPEKYTVLLKRLFPALSNKIIRSRPLKKLRDLKRRLGISR